MSKIVRSTEVESIKVSKKRPKVLTVVRKIVLYEDLKEGDWYLMGTTNFKVDDWPCLCWIREKSNSKISFSLFEIKKGELEFVKKGTRHKPEIDRGTNPLRSITDRELRLTSRFVRSYNNE